MTRLAGFDSALVPMVRNADAVRVAQVGLAGGIGYVHLNEYARNPRFAYVGGFDLYPNEPKVAEAIARVLKMGGTLYRSYEELLADPRVEAVDICTPHHFHRDMAVAAFAAGKHVLVEKPMAPHPEDVAAMIAAQQKAGKVGAVQMQHVGRSSMLELRRAIQGGAIGRIREVFLSSLWWRTEDYYLRAKPPQDWPGRMKVHGKWCIDGALFNQCVHFITQALVLASPDRGGAPAVARARDVRAALYKFHEAANLEAGDTAFVTATLDTLDQPRLTLVGTTCSTEERHQIDMVGTKGRALWNGVGYLFPEGEPMREFHDEKPLFEGSTRTFCSFAEAIRKGGRALTDFSVVQDATRFIYGCYDAAGWQIRKAPWDATATLFGEVIPQVLGQRKLPGELAKKPEWA